MSKRITINGASLNYNDTETDLPVIVTLHGAPGMSSSAGDWRVFASLADRYRIISYDQRGSGFSDLRAPFSFEHFCADLAGCAASWTWARSPSPAAPTAA